MNENTKYAVITDRGPDEDRAIFDTVEDAVWEAKQISRINRLTVTVADITSTDLRDQGDRETFESYGHKICAVYEGGKLAVSEYNFAALKAAAVGPHADEDDMAALAAWFDRYDIRSWNGESYDLGDGLSLFPIYDDEEDEDDSPEIIGWEVR